MTLNLDGQVERDYKTTLTSYSTKRIRASLMTRGHQVIEPLTGQFLDGTVTIDADADVTRAGTIDLLDPMHKLGFDGDTYTHGDLQLTRLIRLIWVTDGDLLAKPVEEPVGTLAVTGLNREGPVVKCTLGGKEVFGLTRSRRTFTARKGARRTDVIVDIARTLMGENRIQVPDLKYRTSEHLVVHPDDQPWKAIEKLAQSMNRQAFFDRYGVLRLRPYPEDAVFRFRAGNSLRTSLTSPISTETGLQDLINQVIVRGKPPKGAKTPPMYVATLRPDEDLSPQWLDHLATLEIENNHCRTVGECRDLAERTLTRRSRLGRTVAFNAVPVPFLEPDDIIAAETDFESSETRVRVIELPLGLGGDMKVGYRGPYRDFRGRPKMHGHGRKPTYPPKKKGDGKGDGKGKGGDNRKDR